MLEPGSLASARPSYQTWFQKSSLESRLMMFSFSLELSLLVWAHFRSAEVSEYSAV